MSSEETAKLLIQEIQSSLEVPWWFHSETCPQNIYFVVWVDKKFKFYVEKENFYRICRQTTKFKNVERKTLVDAIIFHISCDAAYQTKVNTAKLCELLKETKKLHETILGELQFSIGSESFQNAQKHYEENMKEHFGKQ